MPSIFADFRYRMRRAMLRQRPSRMMWAVVAFAAGIALYFGLPREPSLALTGALTFAALQACLFMRRRTGLLTVLMGVFCISAGVFAATWHTARQQVVVLEKNLPSKTVTGTIEMIEFLPTGQRLTLGDVAIDSLARSDTPRRLRLSMRAKKIIPLEVGMRIQLRAGLLPPMGPILRGGFDFSRYFYFRGIGAVGYGMNPITIVKPAQIDGFWQFWEDARVKLARTIRATLDPERAAIASGLITGDDAGISKRTYEELRAANLLHIIAISGSHMVVIAGVVFFSLRMLLLMVPLLGQRMASKQLAAAMTMVAVSAYLCITGVDVSALRAYIMIMLLLLSVLVARQMQPMRALMMTALMMLIYDPSDLMEPGFQLSFAATMAMLAVAHSAILRDRARGEHSLVGRVIYALPWLALISLIAEWVTAPLVMHMFNQFSLYGTFANMIAGPVVSLLIMPSVALFFLSLPLGLETYALTLLDAGIGLLLTIARITAELPHALIYVPSQPIWALVIYALALAFLCLWHGRARLMAIPVMIASTLTVLVVSPPQLIVSQDMRHVVLMDAGEPKLASGRAYAMVPEMLAHAMGRETLSVMPASDHWQCEGKARTRRCVWTKNDQRIFFDFTWDKSGSVCDQVRAKQASMLITDAYGVRCDDVRTITPYRRRIHGAHSWWQTGEDARWQLLTTRMIQGDRPWSPLIPPRY